MKNNQQQKGRQRENKILIREKRKVKTKDMMILN